MPSRSESSVAGGRNAGCGILPKAGKEEVWHYGNMENDKNDKMTDKYRNI